MSAEELAGLVCGTLQNAGITVTLTGGGCVAIWSEGKYNGVHRFAQNHQRLHFGLADNKRVDLRIEWPSGSVDEHRGVNSNVTYRAIEGGSIIPLE